MAKTYKHPPDVREYWRIQQRIKRARRAARKTGLSPDRVASLVEDINRSVSERRMTKEQYEDLRKQLEPLVTSRTPPAAAASPSPAPAKPDATPKRPRARPRTPVRMRAMDTEWDTALGAASHRDTASRDTLAVPDALAVPDTQAIPTARTVPLVVQSLIDGYARCAKDESFSPAARAKLFDGLANRVSRIWNNLSTEHQGLLLDAIHHARTQLAGRLMTLDNTRQHLRLRQMEKQLVGGDATLRDLDQVCDEDMEAEDILRRVTDPGWFARKWQALRTWCGLPPVPGPGAMKTSLTLGAYRRRTIRPTNTEAQAYMPGFAILMLLAAGMISTLFIEPRPVQQPQQQQTAHQAAASSTAPSARNARLASLTTAEQ